MRLKMLLIGFAAGTITGAIGVFLMTGGPITLALTALFVVAVARHFARRAVTRVAGMPAAEAPCACTSTYGGMAPLYPSFHADYHLLPERFLRLASRCAAAPTSR